MSSFPCHADESAFLPARFQDFEQKRASVLKHIARSEYLVEVRPASRLEVHPQPEMLATGIPAVDAISGGIPRGGLTELYGPACSGKTSLLLATIAAAMQQDETCALIDASDSFDPASAQAAGVNFGKLLWVRCGALCNSASAVGKKLKNRNHRGDQGVRTEPTSERRMEQVLKASDLILQSGGFGLVALDLAGIAEKFVRRIPLAYWFRFQRAVEPTKTALLVVSEIGCAPTCAALVVKVCAAPSAISFPPFGNPAHAQLLERMHVQVEMVRSRLGRKVAQSVNSGFVTRAVRAG
jgi:recA bacterial DNA recombination protein